MTFKKGDVVVFKGDPSVIRVLVADQVGDFAWVSPVGREDNPTTYNADSFVLKSESEKQDNYPIGTILAYAGDISAVAVKQNDFATVKWYVLQHGDVEKFDTLAEVKDRLSYTKYGANDNDVVPPVELFVPIDRKMT